MSKKILWIASYPKSGNTFMRSLLSSLIYTDSGEFNFNLLKKVKQFDIHLYFKFIKMINEDDYRKLNDIKVASKYWKLAQKKFIEIDSNFIFKTHAANLMWEKFKYTDEELRDSKNSNITSSQEDGPNKVLQFKINTFK